MIEPLSKLDSNTPIAVFSDLSRYTVSQSETIKAPMSSLILREGIDVSDGIENMTNGEIKKIITFANGYYLGFRRNKYDGINTFADGQAEMYLVDMSLYDSNNRQVQADADALNGSIAAFSIVNGVRKKLPVYMFAAIDTDTKKGYFRVARSIPWSNNSVTNPDTYNSKDYHSASLLYNLFVNGTIYDSDPWSEAGYSGIGGGDGTFDFKSDTIALPDLPSIDAVSSGFLQLFTGNLSSILALSSYMWSTNFFDSIVKITSNPIDIIMGLYMYPFIVPATNQKYIRAGNVITNISMGVPDSQILEIDCGELLIPNFYGAYLDYEPFTKCDLFLPYCGTFPLSMDDIAGKTINVRYRIDLLTGVCGAYVIVDGTVKYNYTGTCAINIPISSRSFENVYNAIMGVVGSMHGGSSFGLPSVGSIAGAVTSGKNQIQHGGNCSGNAGYLGVQKPYVIFSVPRVAIPKGLNKYTGYPIFATYKLADLKGYTEIEQIHLENMGQATQEEIDKIISMLEGGVIL